MKEILVVINTLGRAGAETALMELLRRLDQNGCHVSLYVLMNQGEMVRELPEHVDLLKAAGVCGEKCFRPCGGTGQCLRIFPI